MGDDEAAGGQPTDAGGVTEQPLRVRRGPQGKVFLGERLDLRRQGRGGEQGEYQEAAAHRGGFNGWHQASFPNPPAGAAGG